MPLYVTDRFQHHERERMREPLLEHRHHHSIHHVLVFLEVLVQLLNDVESLNHQLLALHLGLTHKVQAKHDLRLVDIEHLKLVLALVLRLLYLDLDHPDVIAPLCKLFLDVYEEGAGHLYLGQAGLKNSGELGVI